MLLDDLPVATIPSVELFRRGLMPEHRECCLEMREEHDEPAIPVVRLFVSHAWRTKGHPDREGLDWQALRSFIADLVTTSIWLYRATLKLGFRQAQILDQAFESKKIATSYGSTSPGDSTL